MRKGRNPAAFLAMFAGLLCLTLDISLSAGWGTFDLLPDFLGYLLFFLS